jgi:hypothetical protein
MWLSVSFFNWNLFFCLSNKGQYVIFSGPSILPSWGLLSFYFWDTFATFWKSWGHSEEWWVSCGLFAFLNPTNSLPTARHGNVANIDLLPAVSNSNHCDSSERQAEIIQGVCDTKRCHHPHNQKLSKWCLFSGHWACRWFIFIMITTKVLRMTKTRSGFLNGNPRFWP